MVSDTAVHPLKAVLLLVGQIQVLGMYERLKVRLFVLGLFFQFHLVHAIAGRVFSRLSELNRYFSQPHEDFSTILGICLSQTKRSCKVFFSEKKLH